MLSGTVIENESRRTETWEYFVRHLNDNCYPDSTIIEKRFQVKEMESICKRIKIGRGYLLSIKCKNYLNFLERRLMDDKWFSVRGPPLI